MSGTNHSNCIRRVTPKAPDEFISGLLVLDSAWEICPAQGERCTLPCPEDALHLFGIRRGTILLQSGPVSGQFGAGQEILFRGKGALFLSAQTKAECALLQLHGEAAELFCDALEHPVCRWTDDGAAIWETTQEILSLSRDTGAVEASSASLLAYRLLLQLRKNLPQPVPSHSPLVENALHLLDSQFAFLAGVEELAEQLDVSREHLVRAFHREVGIPPGKYLNQRKLEYAKQLLLETDQSISFIGQASGFVSANYFIRVFRTTVGITPRAFRQQAGATAEPGLRTVLEEYYVL